MKSYAINFRAYFYSGWQISSFSFLDYYIFIYIITYLLLILIM